MSIFEYKVIPAPFSGKRAKGVKGADGRFANALSESINELASAGWEYVRAESLPSVERKGLMRKRHEAYQNVLVFRRASDADPLDENADTKDGFNPFKRFSAKTPPVVAAPDVQVTNEKAILSEVSEETDEVEKSDETDSAETPPKRPSKPED
jgi:hypothetical protein